MTSPAALAAGVLAAGVVLFILWPEERRTAAGRARAVIFSLMAGVVAASLLSRQATRMSSPGPARAFEAYTRGLVAARSAAAGRWAGRSLSSFGARSGRPAAGRRRTARSPFSALTDQVATQRQEALRAYAEAVHLAPDSRLFRRQYAILLADAGRREEALPQFRQLGGGRQAVDGTSGKGGPPSRSVGPPYTVHRLPSPPERQLWERLYGPQPPRPAELQALEARLRALDLGWFEELVLQSVYRRMGLTRQAAAAAERVGREAALLNGALTVVVLGMVGAAILGLVLLITGLVRWRQGRLQGVPAVFHTGPAPLLEPFVLYLFLFALPVLFPVLGRLTQSLPPRRAVALTVLLLLGSDLLSLLAAGYLWARLRALGLSLAEIGLHARDLARNLRFGVAGYAVSLPLVAGAGILAHWLGERYFPQVAPPFHPIEALTLTAPSPFLRLALLIIAAVAAPILEELFFRGLLYGALRRRFGVGWGIVASAAVFSSLHPQLPLGFLPIFLLGAILAGLYEWRQSLVPGMVLHALNNGVIWIYLNLLFPPH